MSTKQLTYRPWLAWYCCATLAATLILLYAGAFTTTIGAGMVFLDWPTSNGSFNPPGWWENIAMRAEHSHRLLGMLVGNLTLGLAFWLWKVEPRRWMRRLGWAAVVLVIVQGLLGGVRVLENEVNYAIVHGCVAQIFLCVLAAMVIGQTRIWHRLREEPGLVRNLPNTTGLILIGLVFVQLIVAAVMRHKSAGLAIPTFPLTPEGNLLPSVWNFPIAIHFAHRALALVITALYLYWTLELLRATRYAPVRKFAYISCSMLLLQVLLGAASIWTGREADITTLHVLNGATLLSVTWATHFFTYAPRLEANSALEAADALETQKKQTAPPQAALSS